MQQHLAKEWGGGGQQFNSTLSKCGEGQVSYVSERQRNKTQLLFKDESKGCYYQIGVVNCTNE